MIKLTQEEMEPLDQNISNENNHDDGNLFFSYKRIIFLRFISNKIAFVSAIILFLIYLVTLFCPFFAPYDPHTRFLKNVGQPPQIPSFIDNSGSFNLIPFVYSMKLERDPYTLKRIYKPDVKKLNRLSLFVIGEEYEFLFWKSKLHLFGTEKGQIFILGTDTQGRDLFSRILYGGRISTTIGLISIAISITIGVLIGTVSGYFGGLVDAIIQRGIEVLLSYPTIPLWMTLTAALPKHWSSIRIYFLITIILSIIGWGSIARVIRGMTLSLKNEDFVLSSRMCGAGTLWILLRHILPANLSYVIVAATLAIPGIILAETALSFLGLGIQAPMISWGVMLQEAQLLSSLAEFPWIISPVFFVMITVISFNFVGDGLRDAFDPYSNF